jgi:hypothetical protein
MQSVLSNLFPNRQSGDVFVCINLQNILNVCSSHYSEEKSVIGEWEPIYRSEYGESMQGAYESDEVPMTHHIRFCNYLAATVFGSEILALILD